MSSTISGIPCAGTDVPIVDHLQRLIDETNALFCDLVSADEETSAIIDCARARAKALAAGAARETAAGHLGALIFAAEVIGGLSLKRRWTSRDIDTLIDGLADILALPTRVVKLGVYLGVIDDPRLLALPPKLAIETSMRMLLAFAPISGVSFWVTAPRETLRCVVRLGQGRARGMRVAAETALRAVDRHDANGLGSTDAVMVRRWQHVAGVLAACPHAGQREEANAFLLESARVLGLALEREALLERGVAQERSLVAASERRLARFGYDLHDGPLQDIGAATRELYLLREDISHALSSGEGHDSVLDRLDHFHEILLACEIKVRELAQSAESPAILQRPFQTLLETEIESFVSSTDINADVHLEGDFNALTASQRIALIHVVQEALTNVREHSGASEIRLSVVRMRDRVHAEVVDNGRGFEVERTLVRAAKRGRLGLVGMNERVRLLGGRLDVRSRPGGPTRVSATIPEWRPLRSGTRAHHDSPLLDTGARTRVDAPSIWSGLPLTARRATLRNLLGGAATNEGTARRRP